MKKANKVKHSLMKFSSNSGKVINFAGVIYINCIIAESNV